MPAVRPVRPARRRQRGLYAIEFALVFMLFFTMLYAVVCYGILFAVRMGMQNAAEEGARAGLRYQINWSQRLVEAERETNLRLAWMKYPPTPTAQLCEIGSGICRGATGAAPASACNAATNNLCQIVVSVNYQPYNGSQRWLPPLPGLLLPGSGGALGATQFTLKGRAGVLLERGV
jgi:Flp pilus assembly protein TadG